MTAQLSTFDKRWLDRRERWARPNRPLFDPAGFGVEAMPGRREAAARAFVEQHHYSGSYPASRVAIGLFRKDGPAAEARLVGVAVFSVPMNERAITRHAEVEAREGVELGRFVCAPEVAYNGETWFLARAFKALLAEKTEVRAVLSYADPVERTTAEGRLCKPAHAGTIYRASNAAFVGRAEPRRMWMTREGRIVSPRALAKIRAQDQGHAYAARQLVDAGADERHHGEDPRAWIERVLVEPTFRQLRHPGNLTFVFGLDRAARRIAQAKAQPLPDRRGAS